MLQTTASTAYGSLATYVTRHALAVEGPIREYYLTGRPDTRHRAVAHADLLADLPHRTRAPRSLTPHSGPGLAPVSTAINRATAPVKACSGGVAYPMTSAGRSGPDGPLKRRSPSRARS